MKNPNEKVDEFVVRLRQQMKMCGLITEVQELMFIDKIINNCVEPVLKSRLREKDYVLKEILAIARPVELENTRNKDERTSRASNVDEIRVSNNRQIRGQRFDSNNRKDLRTFLNCGKLGHISSSVGCPARGKRCSKCERIGHFETTCRKRKVDNEQFGQAKYQKRLTTAMIEEKTDYQKTKHEEQYLFYTGGGHLIECTLGGIDLDIIIDSGSDANIIGPDEWKRLKRRGIKVNEQVKGSDRIFMGYANQEN